MNKFLIEIPHGATKEECTRAIQVFKESGSQFLTHADWGCMDGVHKAWFIADGNTKDDALNLVPSEYKNAATVVQLVKLATDAEMEEASDKYHEG